MSLYYAVINNNGGDSELAGYGTVFKISTNGAFTSLYAFTGGDDGAYPQAVLAQGSDGNLYGTTGSGGSGAGFGGPGTLFKISTNGAFASMWAFPGTNDGQNASALSQGRDGSFYGTTYGGGTNYGYGTVFQIAPDGAYASLYSFTGGADGANPNAAPAQGTNGAFYGTTQDGGTNDQGTFFEVSSNMPLTVIYDFLYADDGGFTGGADGSSPGTTVVPGRDGNFYGTSIAGGVNHFGNVFEITPDGVLTTLYSFAGGADGAYPNGLIQDPDGNLYGTAEAGGAHENSGTVFMITTTGTFTNLYSFTGGADGGNPYTSLVQGGDGNYYGTTSQGGTNTGTGTIFEITTNGSLTTLYSFSGGADGNSPSSLLAGTNGNFYGTTFDGGTYGSGAIFSVTASGTLTVMYSFTGGSDGGSPYNPLTLGRDGSLYGTTASGALGGYGGVFRLSASNLPSTPVIQSATLIGGSVQFSWIVTPGFIYQVQYKTNLNQSAWANFGGATNAAGTALNATDSPTNLQRFYRLELVR